MSDHFGSMVDVQQGHRALSNLPCQTGSFATSNMLPTDNWQARSANKLLTRSLFEPHTVQTSHPKSYSTHYDLNQAFLIHFSRSVIHSMKGASLSDMPRSSKATARTSTAPKRTSKRNASEQRDIYSIPESPQSSVASEVEDPSSCTNESETTLRRSSSPAHDTRGRSASIASSKSSSKNPEDDDTTPTQAKPTRYRTASFEPKQFQLPGFEALEAVNGLYQKLKDSQEENEQLKQDKRNLTREIQDHKKQIRNLQTELQAEQERFKAIQVAQDKIDQTAHDTAQENLNTVLVSLRSFGSAAHRIMPLLDVLTDAADIKYDEATEKLYEIMKQHNHPDEDCKTAGVTPESQSRG